MEILKSSNVIASAILGLSLLISAMIVSSALGSVSREIRAKPLPGSTHVPSEFTVRVQNGGYDSFKVQTKSAQ